MLFLLPTILCSTLRLVTAVPAVADSINWKTVDSLVGPPSVAQPGDVHRFNFPRGDLRA